MTLELDCRGMNCPAPVIHVRNALEHGRVASVSVLVDNDAARQNVSRFLEHENYDVKYEANGEDFCVSGKLTNGVQTTETTQSKPYPVLNNRESKKIMVLITGSRIGHGDDSLGDMLMFNFLKTLKEMLPELNQVTFVNSGVHFTAGDSEAVPILKELSELGVTITACGACLAFFHILDKIEVGTVTNMLDIINAMKESDSVITI